MGTHLLELASEHCTRGVETLQTRCRGGPEGGQRGSRGGPGALKRTTTEECREREKEKRAREESERDEVETWIFVNLVLVAFGELLELVLELHQLLGDLHSHSCTAHPPHPSLIITVSSWDCSSFSPTSLNAA